MGHQGSEERKVQAIHNMDTQILSYATEKLDASGEDYRLLVLPITLHLCVFVLMFPILCHIFSMTAAPAGAYMEL